MGQFSKTLIWAAVLTMFTSVFTACNSNKSDIDEGSTTVSEVTTEEVTTEPHEDTGIFVDFNENDYSVDMAFKEIYDKNDISTDKIDNVINENSGLYYELDIKITSENVDALRDSSGVYVAELDLATCELKNCGDLVTNDATETVLIMFGDKNLMDTEYLCNAFDIDNNTKTLLVKGVFRGHTALYPMLVESKNNKVYVYKPFLEMSKTW